MPAHSFLISSAQGLPACANAAEPDSSSAVSMTNPDRILATLDFLHRDQIISGLPLKADLWKSAVVGRYGPNGDIPPVVDHELGYDSNSSSNAFASFRSSVSNPSVNQL